MRIGIFGGTFDPVHYGHLLLAEQCREQLELDAVWLMPAAVPPHKQRVGISDAKHRVAMLELAAAGHPPFQVSRLELERGGTSFTVDTLSALHAEAPDRELVLLIGADSLTDLSTWREPQRILELSQVAAVNRGRQMIDLAEIHQSIPGAAGRIVSVAMPAVDLSATDIRARVAAGRSIRFMVPRAVEEYIRQHGLYRR
ncbi:MAG: nicotinate-nucleotide adenylyltransferase [Planctomycetaceae bacterium]|nr:nicotinate-nucleotide adenylyltransferase [Planctomycetaceae bacterium]